MNLFIDNREQKLIPLLPDFTPKQLELGDIIIDSNNNNKNNNNYNNHKTNNNNDDKNKKTRPLPKKSPLLARRESSLKSIPFLAMETRKRTQFPRGLAVKRN